MAYFGTELIEATDASAILTGITTMLTDNLPAVFVLVGGLAGIAMFRSVVNRAKKGKV